MLRSRIQTILKWFSMSIGAGLVILGVFGGWWVSGPASRIPAASHEGVPANSWPKMSAVEVRDLPLSCKPVVTDNVLTERAARPHRNHVYLAEHNGQFFIMFSQWYGAEDQPGGSVYFATSKDGSAWSEPQALAEPAPGHGVIARGFVKRGDGLYAWIATHTGDTFFRNGKKFADPEQWMADRNIAILEYAWQPEGSSWVFNRTVLNNVLNNYAPQEFGGTMIMSVRDQDRANYLAVSEDEGMQWSLSDKMPVPEVPELGELGLYLPDEPVTVAYSSKDAKVVLRNNNTADGRLWAASYRGGKWTAPYPLAFPADASKFLPIKLADGQSALIGNFNVDVRRALLHIALSADGQDYDRLYRLSLEGQYSGFRWRSPQYPHAIVTDKALLLAVSYGKRAIWVCRGPPTAKGIEAATEFRLAPRIAAGICSKQHPTVLRRLFGYAGCVEHFVWG